MEEKLIDSNINVLEKPKVSIQIEDPWNVVFYNDNITPMDFVIFILMSIFNRTVDAATALTFKIHTSGKAIVATYSSYDEAEIKTFEATKIAEKYNYPLVIKAEK